MSEELQPTPEYAWATNADPDVLVLQLSPLPVFTVGGSHDAMKLLFAQRGFRPMARAEVLDLGAANGCVLSRTGPRSAELLVSIGDRVGASRIPFPDLDPQWLGRVVASGHAAVLLVDAAVSEDGTTTRDRLRRDVDAGGVLGALVPSADTED